MADNVSQFNAPVLRQEMIITSVLEHLTSIDAAQKVQPLTVARDGNPPAVAFGTKQHDGQTAYGPDMTSHSIEQVQILIDGNPRYFKRIAASNGLEPDNHTGFSASAWLETDKEGITLTKQNGKSDIRLCYPGYKGVHLHETESALAVKFGRMNPQVYAVKGFVDKVLGLVDKEHIDSINIGSHSMGASNALASHFYLQCIGINSSAILIEPWGASLAVKQLKEHLADPSNALAKSMIPAGTRLSSRQIETMLTKDTVSIRAATQENGSFSTVSRVASSPLLHPGISADNNDMVGKNVLLDMEGSKNIADHWVDPYHLLVNVVYQLMTHPDNLLVLENNTTVTKPEIRRAENKPATQNAWVAVPLHGLLSPGRAPA